MGAFILDERKTNALDPLGPRLVITSEMKEELT